MLETLRQIILEVNNSKDLGEALATTVQRLLDVTRADTCSIFLVDKDRGEHVLMATAGLNKKLIGKLRVKFGEGLIGLIGEREEPINIPDTVEHPKFCHYQEVTKHRYHAFLGVPIIYQRDLLGILVAQKVAPGSFTENDEAFLTTIAAQLAGIIAMSKASGPIPGLSKTKKDNILEGVSCSAGVAFGKIVVIYPPADLESIPDKQIKEKDIDGQVTAFKDAVKAVRKEIAGLSKDLAPQLLKAEQGLFDAYLEILNSRSIKREVLKEIKAGNWAQGALRKVFKKRTAQFAKMENEYIKERAADILDLGERILGYLQVSEHKPISYPKNTILMGEKITPAAIAEIPDDRLVGIISIQGSSNSHMAILARALGIPAVIGITEFPSIKLDKKPAIIDGYYGQVYISPSEETATEFAELVRQEEELDSELNKIRNLPAETIDHHTISLQVNVGLPIDIGHSLRAGAEGVGLYRTEISFMGLAHFPSEEQQFTVYKQLLKVFAPRPVTMRTLDIGGDKPLPYFPIKEENPFLGWRGIRITLDHPEIFLVQIKAMLRANHGQGNLRIILPMISSISEIEAAIKLINQAHKELAEEIPDISIPEVGAMIEVPSAVYQANELARRVDFFSVGSNDLTQYLLAVDRGNTRIMHLYDYLHPAVLRAMSEVVLAAHKHNKKISVCGEMAAEPTAVVLLLAMGFDELSMNASQLLRVKWLIRNFSMARAKQLLAEVMTMDDATEIRYLIEHAIDEAGVAGLIRAGK